MKFNHNTPSENGRHPKYSHLVLSEVENHKSMLILTIEKQKGDALISWDDWKSMIGDDEQSDEEFGYISDEYISILED